MARRNIRNRLMFNAMSLVMIMSPNFEFNADLRRATRSRFDIRKIFFYMALCSKLIPLVFCTIILSILPRRASSAVVNFLLTLTSVVSNFMDNLRIAAIIGRVTRARLVLQYILFCIRNMMLPFSSSTLELFGDQVISEEDSEGIIDQMEVEADADPRPDLLRDNSDDKIPEVKANSLHQRIINFAKKLGIFDGDVLSKYECLISQEVMDYPMHNINNNKKDKNEKFLYPNAKRFEKAEIDEYLKSRSGALVKDPITKQPMDQNSLIEDKELLQEIRGFVNNVLEKIGEKKDFSAEDKQEYEELTAEFNSKAAQNGESAAAASALPAVARLHQLSTSSHLLDSGTAASTAARLRAMRR